MEKEKLIVVGGDAAGMSAASKVKRENPDFEVVVFERGGYVSYGMCGLPYYISGEVADLEDLVAITAEEFRQKRNIDVRLHHEVTEVDPEGKQVRVRKGNGEEFIVGYDKLLIATGARPKIPPIEGVELSNVFTVHWLPDGERIRKFIEKEHPKDVAIIGGGYIGMEMAEAFKKMGLNVTLLAKHDQVMKYVDPDIAQLIEEELIAHGVEVHKGSKAESFEGDSKGRVRRVNTSTGSYDVDFALMAVGVRPEVELAQGADVKIGETGAIVVDERMETSVEGIYAAGDCVETKHLVSGKGVYLPLGDTANQQGRVAGTNIAGGQASFPGVVGTSVFKVFDLAVGRTGLTKREAEQEDFNCFSSKITASSRAFYYPGGQPITIKLIVDSVTGKLLGAQLVGKEGVSQRLNVLATVIHRQGTVQELQYFDFGYAPPYAPVWDPVLTAAKVAAGKL
jgi:NADPH-dependent 2,4-dienoyl-CoA reductase/sulfur reductase-like enzyme